MPLVHRPLTTAVRLSASWAHDCAVAWAVASQQRSRRNAMVASTRLAQRRVEAAEVTDYLLERPLAAGGALGTVGGEVAHA